MATSFCLLEIVCFVPVHEKCCTEQTHNDVTFGQMLAMELQKAVEGNQNKNINNSPGFIVLQTQLPYFMALQLNKSFLILDKEKSFCYKIYLLLTKLVWS